MYKGRKTVIASSSFPQLKVAKKEIRQSKLEYYTQYFSENYTRYLFLVSHITRIRFSKN